MIAAAPIKLGIDPLGWEIWSRIELGPLAISPHGLGIALGFFVGARYMVRRAKRSGGPDENVIWNGLFWALIGAIAGARLAYVVGHLAEVTDQFRDVLGIFKVWEGGISLLGGIIGGVVAALPYMRKHQLAFWPTMDLVAPGLALGIFLGRIGDLMIGDHLGKPTSFALGWRCLGDMGRPPLAASEYAAALARGEPPSLGCYDVVVHQTALYDFVLAGALFGVLVWLSRRPHRTGFLALVFGAWYGTARLVEDTLRVDKRYFGLTGSQITALIVVVISLYLLGRYRGAPPGTVPEAPASAPERDQEVSGSPA